MDKIKSSFPKFWEEDEYGKKKSLPRTTSSELAPTARQMNTTAIAPATRRLLCSCST